MRAQGDVLAHGHFGNVPLAVQGEAVEDFFNRQVQRAQLDALGVHRAVGHVARVVIGAKRQGEG